MSVTDVPAAGEVANDRSLFGHPRALATLFLTEMWERFSSTACGRSLSYI